MKPYLIIILSLCFLENPSQTVSNQTFSASINWHQILDPGSLQIVFRQQCRDNVLGSFRFKTLLFQAEMKHFHFSCVLALITLTQQHSYWLFPLHTRLKDGGCLCFCVFCLYHEGMQAGIRPLSFGDMLLLPPWRRALRPEAGPSSSSPLDRPVG